MVGGPYTLLLKIVDTFTRVSYRTVAHRGWAKLIYSRNHAFTFLCSQTKSGTKWRARKGGVASNRSTSGATPPIPAGCGYPSPFVSCAPAASRQLAWQSSWLMAGSGVGWVAARGVLVGPPRVTEPQASGALRRRSPHSAYEQRKKTPKKRR